MTLKNERNTNEDDATLELFWDAVDEEDIEKMRELFAEGIGVDTPYFGRTALERAAYLGHVQAAKLLLAKGVDVNYYDDEGSTALKLAAGEGHADMVNLLLDHNADMTIYGGGDNGTPLHEAARFGHVEIVRLLVDRGADPNMKDGDGETVSYLQRLLFLNSRPDVTNQILALLKEAGATD